MPALDRAASAAGSCSLNSAPLCALPPHTSNLDPLQRPLIAVETTLKKKIRTAYSLI